MEAKMDEDIAWVEFMEELMEGPDHVKDTLERQNRLWTTPIEKTVDDSPIPEAPKSEVRLKG
jgi:hypothetical protein